jgi:site-specific recombinase XerD
MKVNEKLSMLLVLEKSKTSSDGRIPITVRLTVDCKRVELSLGQKVLPEMWNQKAGMANGSSKEAMSINTTIDRVRNKLRQHYDVLSTMNGYVSAAMVKEAYQGKKQECRTLLEAIAFVEEKAHKKVEKEVLEQVSADKWRRTREKLIPFLKHEYKLTDIALDKITYSFAEDLADYLMLVRDLGNNTAMNYVKNIKQALKQAVQRNWILRNPIEAFTCGYINPERDILDDEEIMHMYKKKMPVARLEEVKNTYLFMCFTGYAYTDASLLTPEHVCKFFDGEDWIVKNREKTWCRENVPLMPMAKEIIERYRNHPYCLDKNMLLPIKSNQNFNAYLKEVADICGIKKNLTTHTARHTFATTVTLANGVPLETVSALLGHKSIKTTQIYAKIVAKKISADMKLLKAKLKFMMPVSLQPVEKSGQKKKPAVSMQQKTKAA